MFQNLPWNSLKDTKQTKTEYVVYGPSGVFFFLGNLAAK
jgi:hypothetical protein